MDGEAFPLAGAFGVLLHSNFGQAIQETLAWQALTKVGATFKTKATTMRRLGLPQHYKRRAFSAVRIPFQLSPTSQAVRLAFFATGRTAPSRSAPAGISALAAARGWEVGLAMTAASTPRNLATLATSS